VFVVDDGSTDGTADAIRANYPSVRVIQGSGQLYWNGGMRRAFVAALEEGFDFYVLLNDDTHLYTDAFSRLLTTARLIVSRDTASAIAVGSTCDRSTGRLTYGGWCSKSSRFPTRLQLIQPADEPICCSTFNANCVLIPHEVATIVGPLDVGFTHALGDFDYGLRAGKRGIPSWIAAGFVGECEHNIGIGSWTDLNVPLFKRWRIMLGPKGLPPREWLLYCSRHAGYLWPMLWIWPYIDFWLRVLFGR